MITRNQIISEVTTWIGTPFHHNARSKFIGCDCVGLIIGVAQAFGIFTLEALLIPNYDYYKDKEYFLKCMKSHLKLGSKKTGTIAVVGSYDSGWHTGFINQTENKCTWIHACMRAKVVTEQRFFEGAFYFDLPEINN